MSAAKKRTAFEGVFQEIGTVMEDPRDGLVVVETPSGRYSAKVAASCLLEPAIDDEVLLAVPLRGDLYVLAVLERRGDEPARLRLGDAGVELAVPGGALEITARDGVRVMTPARLELVAGTLSAIAKEGFVHAGRLAVEGREVVARAEVVKTVVDTLESTAVRVVARMKRSTRVIEETDITRAGSIDARAEQTLVLRAKDALVHARRLFKLDGEQIHLG